VEVEKYFWLWIGNIIPYVGIKPIVAKVLEAVGSGYYPTSITEGNQPFVKSFEEGFFNFNVEEIKEYSETPNKVCTEQFLFRTARMMWLAGVTTYTQPIVHQGLKSVSLPFGSEAL
jgi:hypothetical protein